MMGQGAKNQLELKHHERGWWAYKLQATWQGKIGSSDPPKNCIKFRSVICPFSPSCFVIFVVSQLIPLNRASMLDVRWPSILLLSLRVSSYSLASSVAFVSFSYQQKFREVSHQLLAVPPHPSAGQFQSGHWRHPRRHPESP